MRIAVINPPLIFSNKHSSPHHHVFQPLGLAYIAAVLEEDHDVIIIDAVGEGWKNIMTYGEKKFIGLPFKLIKEKIKNYKPELVGISVPFSINFESALLVASLIKNISRDIITVMGGPHPSIRPKETLSSHYVDYIVIGEGEITIKELTNIIEKGAIDCLKSIAGIGFKINKKIHITNPRILIRDLNSLPFPARHLLPMEEYFEAEKKMRASRSMYNFSGRYASIITSRGCPYKCCFCSIKLTMGNSFRARSPGNIVQEIEQIINDYEIEHINFEDDNLTCNKERTHILIDNMIKKGFGISWSTPNGIRADTIDEEIIRKFRLSGCKRVFVAPESGSQKVVTNIIGKKLDLKKVEKSIRLFKKHNIIVDASFVIGFIGETKKDIWKTIKYAYKLKKIGMSEAGFHIAIPLYGTKLYQEAKLKGYLISDIKDNDFLPSVPLIETPEWSAKDLLIFLSIANWIVNYSTRDKVYSLLRKVRQILKVNITILKGFMKGIL
jgi:magnesium-protoporphyrin IX monomethyl ester (oxidative) cyclase